MTGESGAARPQGPEQDGPDDSDKTALTQSIALTPTEPSSFGEHPQTWTYFRDLRPIGSGGFGSVYRAWDTQLHREVALKLIRPRDRGEEDYVAALQEARMMARAFLARIFGSAARRIIGPAPV